VEAAAPEAPAAPPPATEENSGDPVAPGSLPRRWQIVVFLWITAFVALALYELLQAVFRLL
jgi:hypothetical protein